MKTEIENLYDRKPASYTEADFQLFAAFREALNQGRVRAAEPCAGTPTGWRVNTWVKKGILLGFRMGGVIDMSIDAAVSPSWINPLTRSGNSRRSPACALCRGGRAFATAAT